MVAPSFETRDHYSHKLWRHPRALFCICPLRLIVQVRTKNSIKPLRLADDSEHCKRIADLDREVHSIRRDGQAKLVHTPSRLSKPS